MVSVLSLSNMERWGIKDEKKPSFRDEEQFTLKSGSYEVGQQFDSGAYDVEVVEGSVQFMEKKMLVGTKIINRGLQKNEIVDVDGNGKVMLTKHKIVPLELQGEHEHYHIIHSGDYIAGQHLPQGKYLLSINSAFDNPPLVQILENERILTAYDFLEQKEYEINIAENQILQVHKTLFIEEEGLQIFLTPNP